MTYLGLDPDLARSLSLALRQAGVDAEGLSDEVVGALFLAELESVIPDQIDHVGDDLDDVGLIVSTRVDLAEGLVIDPVILAEELGLTTAQVNQALEALTAESDVNARKHVTPFFQLRANAEAGAEVLRGAFVDLPAPGEDPILDAALEELGLILPGALVDGELDIELLNESQRQALEVLAAAIGVIGAGSGAPARSAPGWAGPAVETSITFALVAKAFELDQRLAAAAGLPEIADILFQARVEGVTNLEFDETWAPLDEFLPALLVGEGEIPTDPADRSLTLSFARNLGFGGSTFDGALAFLKGRRFLQRSLISGNFEGVDGPLLVWTEDGVNNALLAGRRNGVLDDVSREQAEFLAANFLTGDGSGEPIELTEELTQALGAIVIGQNGEDFVLENAQIQRQLMSAINLIGRQPTLEDQRRLFADSIEAFRSLAVVGAPAITYRQLRSAVGPIVMDELSYSDLTTRSEKGYNKRPQFLSLLNQWGIPGADTLKLKKYKFSYVFDESGELTYVRNKKLSKWKRFKNSIKALGQALKQAWKDNPWGVIWEGVKLVAAAVLTVVPGTNAIGAALFYASITVLVADMAYQAAKGNWMEALSSGFTALSGGASYFGQAATAASAAATAAGATQAATAAAKTASTAAKFGKFASAGQKVLAAIEYGEDFVDAVGDGDVLGALSSGAGALAKGASVFPGSETVGTTANLVATGAQFVASGVETVNAGIDTYDAIQDGDALGILSSSFNLISSGIDTIEQGGNFANSSSAFLGGVTANQGAIERASVDEITGEAARDLEDDFTHRVVSSDTLRSLSTFSDYAANAAQVTNISAAVIDGDLIGAAQQGVRFLGDGADEGTQLALTAADKGLAVAKIVENVYRGGAVPEGEQLFDALFELGAAAGAAFAGPADRLDPPDPRETVRADGTVLIDYDGDGIDDALVTSDGVQLDLDGDGTFDVAFDDTDGDGRGDTRAADPLPPVDEDDLDLVLNSLAPLDDSIVGSFDLFQIDGQAVSADLIREFNARTDAVFRTDDGVEIVRPDGSVQLLTTEQIDAVILRTERELERLDEGRPNPRTSALTDRERDALQAEIARLKELRLTTPEGVAQQIEYLQFRSDQLAQTNLSPAARDRVQLAIDRELQALEQLDKVAVGGQVLGPDNLPRALVAADLAQIDVPTLLPTRVDQLTDRINTNGDIAGAVTAALQDLGNAGAARQQAAIAEILLEHGIDVVDASIPGVVFDAAGVAYEVIEAGQVGAAGGDVTKELVEGIPSAVLGIGLGVAGAPGLVVFGATFTTELAIGEIYDRVTYEHQGGTFQLESGETVTLASTTPSGPPVGVPVSYRIVDDGQSIDATVNVRVDDREVQLSADQVNDLMTGNTKDNYEDSINELVRIFQEEGPVRQRGAYRTDAIRALESIEALTEASSHLLPPGVADLFKQPF